MKHVRVSAPGKLHLLGEHSVVYGKSAIIAAVDKRCFIDIIPSSEPKIIVKSVDYNQEISLSFKDLDVIFKTAQKDWKLFKNTNDINYLKNITKKPLDYPLIIIGQFLTFHKLHEIAGFSIIIDSQIPEGAGMGSSGALTVSIVGALTLFFEKDFNKKIINKIAFLCEQKKHGNPSGGDNTASCFGNLIWFKKNEEMKRLSISIPKKIRKNIYIVNSGKPLETTGEMIGKVANLLKKEHRLTQKIFDDQEALVHKLLPALEKADGNKIMEILKKGEFNLEKLGVVSKYSQSIIREIEKSGGVAKICGGGGVKKGTGIILIYHPAGLKKLEKVLKSYNIKISQLIIGVDGLRKE